MRFYFRLVLIYITLAICPGTIWGQRQTRVASFEEYINKYKSLAIEQQKKYSIPASITLAQGLLESAAGNSRLAVQANNHFGIKCKKEWRGAKIYHDDDEKGECFRAYKSAQESYIDHSKFLSERTFYVSLFKLDIHDYKGWAYGLQACGYATDKSYGEKLVRIIETYELYKYDYTKYEAPEPIIDDIYEIAIEPSEKKEWKPTKTNWRRRIYETNGVHFITAQDGDTYESIAKEAKMSLKKLLKYNDATKELRLDTDNIVYLQAKKKYAAKGYSTHTVRAGESLHGISQSYGMRLKTLYKLNKLKEDYRIKPGDVLKLRK
ncbi:MAG: glucosaminidase domain-containing protein [Tannerella sp.]|jgi:LysM repeat protein|nr:glucosaminidase domain-containing protein [Tannerella sp.]